MNSCKIFALIILIFTGIKAEGQGTDTLRHTLDSLRKIDTTRGKEIDVSKSEFNQNTKITPRVYFTLLETDFIQEAIGPFHSTKKTWIRVGEFAAIEAGLFFVDKPVQRYAVRLTADNPTVANVSSYVTRFGAQYETYTLAALGAYSYIFRNEKVKTTVYLATQSYIVSAAVQSISKILTSRERPNSYHADQTEPRGTFHGPFGSSGVDMGGTKLNGSFPSGHTTAAFAAATVFAIEYKNQKLIPVIAYSAATLVGLSRITENKHWATDVFLGAALGYVTGKQVSSNYHRYAKMRNEHPEQFEHGRKKRHGVAMLDLQYNYGHLMPGLVYKFN